MRDASVEAAAGRRDAAARLATARPDAVVLSAGRYSPAALCRDLRYGARRTRQAWPGRRGRGAGKAFKGHFVAARLRQ